MITELAPLGRDALGEEDLTALVRTITGDPGAVPATVRHEPVDYPIGTPSTDSLHRVFGTTRDGAEWSCFVKKLQSVRHSPIIELVPLDMRQDFIEYMPWQLEVAVHRSGIDDLMPTGMRLPVAYRIDEYDDDRATVWMENVVQEWGPWPIDRFERAAYLLGRLSARRRPHLVEPLLSRPRYGAPGFALRYYANGRILRHALPALADPKIWRQPMLAAAVCNLGEHALKDDLLALGERVPAVLDALDALPQCYQHGDASPQNLLVPHDRPDEFVAIDWGFDCPQAVGFDLGQLLIGLAHAGELAPEALPAVHRVILKGFREGLAADGMPVDEDEVLYGYLGSLLVRAVFTALPLELFGKADESFALFEDRVRLTRTLVDLVSPVV